MALLQVRKTTKLFKWIAIRFISFSSSDVMRICTSYKVFFYVNYGEEVHGYHYNPTPLLRKK